MEVITSLRKERGKMLITAGSETYTVSMALFRERPLAEGEELDPEEYDNWLMVRQYRQALDRAVGYLSVRARSRREIESRLMQAGYRASTVEMVLYKLEKESLLDDADFAKQWVAARSNRQLGRQRIAMELRHKGVSAEEAEEALAQLGDDDQLSGAVALVEKALRRVPDGEDPRKTANRITGMLARRGYGWDIARKAIAQAMADMDE